MSDHRVHITLSLPPKLVDELDIKLSATRHTRSGFIAGLITAALAAPVPAPPMATAAEPVVTRTRVR